MHILIGVSGGIDSVVLVHLFHQLNYRMAIAHCNFKLRGKESDDDEKFVQNLGKQYGIPVFSKSFNTSDFAEKENCSLQEAARKLRYQWFEALCAKNDFDRIAIAHHADDQVETFFINLLRSSGLKGLKGMPVKRDKIIRPLLFASRNNIIAYANAHQIQFREDSSNTSDKYLRNAIRHYLIPKLEDLKENAANFILKSMSHLQDDNQEMELLIEKLRDELIIRKSQVKQLHIAAIKPLSASLFYKLIGPFDFNTF